MSEERGMERAELATLADAINVEHRACETALRVGLAHAVKAGELLIEAKALCAHGTWLPWLSANFEGSDRTAQAYMQVARGAPSLAEGNPQRVADLSYREALAELAAPRPPATDTVAIVKSACDQLDRESERFVRELAKALTRVGPTREEHLFWVRQSVERARSVLDQLESYVETGRTDLDAFLEDVLQEEDR